MAPRRPGYWDRLDGDEVEFAHLSSNGNPIAAEFFAAGRWKKEAPVETLVAAGEAIGNYFGNNATRPTYREWSMRGHVGSFFFRRTSLLKYRRFVEREDRIISIPILLNYSEFLASAPACTAH